MPPEAASVELHELDVLEAADLTCCWHVSWGSSHLRVIPGCRVYQGAVLKGWGKPWWTVIHFMINHCKGGEVVVVVRGRGLACSLVSEKEYEQLGQFTKNYHKPLDENHQSCHKTKTVLCLEFTIWDHSPPCDHPIAPIQAESFSCRLVTWHHVGNFAATLIQQFVHVDVDSTIKPHPLFFGEKSAFWKPWNWMYILDLPLTNPQQLPLGLLHFW